MSAYHSSATLNHQCLTLGEIAICWQHCWCQHADLEFTKGHNRRSNVLVHNEANMNRGDTISDIISNLRITRLYHMTPAANEDQIYQHGGLVARVEHPQRGITCRYYLSNELSRQLDSQRHLDRFVHLSFVRKYPMVHDARYRIGPERIRVFHINPKVLELEGVQFTNEVANSSYSQPYLVQEMNSKLRLNRPPDEEFLSNPASSLEDLIYPKAQVLVPAFIPLRLVLRIEDL